MNATELQQWLNAHGQMVAVDGKPGPQTRAAIIAAFTNDCAAAVTPGEIEIVASRLGCSVKQVKAVAAVESSGAGFDKLGRPKILFERHLFHRFTGGRYTPASFSEATAGGYREDSWEKLSRAACKDTQAAFAAVSWGRFQVLGAHARGDYPGFLDLGYPSPIEMAYSAVTGEASHFEMLVRYVEKAGLVSAMRRISVHPDDCRAFAKGYNGGSYERYEYHTKLARAMR